MIAIIQIALTVHMFTVFHGAWDSGGKPSPSHWNNTPIVSVTNAVGTNKLMFVDAFMPGVDQDEVLYLQYIRGGSREPPYLAAATFSETGLRQLRNNTQRSDYMEMANGTIINVPNSGIFTMKPELQDLITRVDWWKFDEEEDYEVRVARWRGDHWAKFYISTNTPVVFIDAIIH